MPRTDSAVIEYNEDGSRTITTIETVYPVTKKQQAVAIGGLTVLALLPVVPLLAISAYEKYEEKRAERKEARKLKSVK